MLNERQGRSVAYDAAARTALVTVSSSFRSSGSSGPERGGQTVSVPGLVLVDASGEVVGVDVDPDSASRVVVMLGRHESVARTEPRRLTVVRDRRGEVTSVLVLDFTR